MGSLHKGHLSLVSRSKSDNDITIVSIYVNPTQFNDKDDFISYPTNIEKDKKLLKKVNCDVLFLPESDEMYAEGYKEINVDLGNLSLFLESSKRPSHFQGVLFIVNKLFKIIMPNKTYFGEKDFQQLLIIKRLVNKHFKQIKIISCQTVRDNDGLALSSRNKKLSLKEINIAKKVFKLMISAREIILAGAVKESKKYVDDFFSKNEELTLDYYEIIDESTFSLVNSIENKKLYRLMIAFKIGGVRLIDNLRLNYDNRSF